ncbi:DUF397 domain-containing protein [Streptomyces albidoflavus]
MENANWQKARASINDGNCVEVAATSEGVAMRNSRFPGDPALLFTEAEMTAFLDGVKAGEFDHLAG